MTRRSPGLYERLLTAPLREELDLHALEVELVQLDPAEVQHGHANYYCDSSGDIYFP